MKKDRLIVVAFVVSFLLLLALASCKTIYVPGTDHYIHDTTYVSKTDYITKYDSVFVKEKGDTLYIYKYRYIDRYKADTIYKSVTDTIIVTNTKYIEKQLSLWQRFELGAFGWLVGLVFVLAGLLWLLFKRR